VTPGDSVAHVAKRFVNRHAERAGFTLDRPVEFISARITLSSEPWPVRLMRPERAGELPRDVDDGRAMERSVTGDAVVRLPDATMRVAAGWQARALAMGGWMLEQL
jgi:N-methylhydantoinase A